MMHSAVADAKPWPDWLCPSGALASQLRPLDDVPCYSDESEEKEPEPFPADAAKEETQEEKDKHDDDDEDGDASVLSSPTSPCDEQSHRKAAVSARLAQDEEEATAQAAVAAMRTQAATLEGWDPFFGCVHLGKVKQKAVDLRWWVKGVHQIVLWVGTARQGKGASKGSAKGKGAGAAVAARYPKAKTQGKKW